MRISESDIAKILNRLRWETAAGLSAFKNLDPHLALECAEMRLKAIERILVEADAANDAVPVH